MRENFYITTAIDYVNASPHLGHALKKFRPTPRPLQRLLNKEVYFLTGVDEHGIKIVRFGAGRRQKRGKFYDENSEI